METSIAILLMFFLTGIFLTWFFIHKAREKERLLLIEKGVDLSKLPISGKFRISFPWLKLGIIVTSISTGVLLGVLLMPFYGSRSNEVAPLMPIFMFLFGGIGFILASILDKPKEQK
jgi:hypothetical protein